MNSQVLADDQTGLIEYKQATDIGVGDYLLFIN